MVATEDWGVDRPGRLPRPRVRRPQPRVGRRAAASATAGSWTGGSTRQTRNDELDPQHLRGARRPRLGPADAGLADLRPLVLLAARPHQPNRYYLYSGQSAGLKNNDLPPELVGDQHPDCALGWDWPTVWDLCAQRRVERLLLLQPARDRFWGARQLDVTHHVTDFFAGCALGRPPAGLDHRPVVHGPDGHLQRRPPRRGHPPRADVPLRHRPGLHQLPALQEGRARHHLRRVGRLLGPRGSAPGRRPPRHPRGPRGLDDFSQSASASRPR